MQKLFQLSISIHCIKNFFIVPEILIHLACSALSLRENTYFIHKSIVFVSLSNLTEPYEWELWIFEEIWIDGTSPKFKFEFTLFSQMQFLHAHMSFQCKLIQNRLQKWSNKIFLNLKLPRVTSKRFLKFSHVQRKL